MSVINSPLEIYKHLPKTNCRECQAPTCLAFAAAVINGQKPIKACPHLGSEIVGEISGKVQVKQDDLEQRQKQMLEHLKKRIGEIDFSSAAERLGASLSGDRLVVKLLGKPFYIDSSGNVTSDYHLNLWVLLPLLNYVALNQGKNVSGQWVPFRELKKGSKYNPLFEKRCEEPLKKVADKDMELWGYILQTMGGKPAEVGFEADIALVLYPLPKVPVLFCYTRPEDDLDSRLNIFFDQTADDNLTSEGVYYLIGGLAVMFEKMAMRHG